MGAEQRQLDSALRAIRVKAWRLHLETPGVVATVPMLRGVWGAALRVESEVCVEPGRLLRSGQQSVIIYSFLQENP